MKNTLTARQLLSRISLNSSNTQPEEQTCWNHQITPFNLSQIPHFAKIQQNCCSHQHRFDSSFDRSFNNLEPVMSSPAHESKVYSTYMQPPAPYILIKSGISSSNRSRKQAKINRQDTQVSNQPDSFPRKNRLNNSEIVSSFSSVQGQLKHFNGNGRQINGQYREQLKLDGKNNLTRSFHQLEKSNSRQNGGKEIRQNYGNIGQDRSVEREQNHGRPNKEQNKFRVEQKTNLKLSSNVFNEAFKSSTYSGYFSQPIEPIHQLKFSSSQAEGTSLGLNYSGTNSAYKNINDIQNDPRYYFKILRHLDCVRQAEMEEMVSVLDDLKKLEQVLLSREKSPKSNISF